VIGFIGGSAGVIEGFRAGYEAGANWIDPDVEVLATYVAQPFVDQLGWVQGFVRADLGHDRAAALYERGADVVFHAAGYSGWGLFDAVVEQSEATGSHLWAIGVDNDQWFDVDEDSRGHVLTSVIKRGDVAAYLLVEEMLSDEPDRSALSVGLLDDAFDYSTQGDGLTDEMIATLDRIEVDIAEGRIEVPSVTSGPVLNLDPVQNAIEEAFADLDPRQINEYVETWLAPRFPDEMDSCLEVGLDLACAQLIIDHRAEWEAAN
jgi:basic membrane protein A